MKNIFLILLFIPLLLVSQIQPKPKTTPAKKPATTTTKKPATTAAKKPATTAGPKKPNPKVVLLTEKAYKLYNESKDAECEKVIKQILVLDPKNKDAFLLRANIAMFAFKYEEMWKNLDKHYKFYPKEPEVYSSFAMTHLNYYFLSDSAKKALCRKTIKLASRNAEGYAAMGMVSAVGGNYFEALDYFDISYIMKWKDTLSRVVLDLPYANCLYNTGDTIGAIRKLDRIIPRMTGKDKYTCVFLRVKYKIEINDTGISSDLDTLNNYAPNQPEVLILNAKYLSKTNRKDSACKMAKMVRLAQGGEAFDLSPFCDDIVKSFDMTKYKTLTYSMDIFDFTVNLEEFNYPASVRFNWTKNQIIGSSLVQKGKVFIAKKALDSAYLHTVSFENESDATLDKAISFWMSKVQISDIARDSTTKFNMNGTEFNAFKFVSHEQVELYTVGKKLILVDCMVLSDGTNKLYYMNDPANPLLVKIESEKVNILLTKIE